MRKICLFWVKIGRIVCIFDQMSRLCYILNAQPEILIFNVCYKYFEHPPINLVNGLFILGSFICEDWINIKRISEDKTSWMLNLNFKSLMDSRGRGWKDCWPWSDILKNSVGPGPIYWILALALVRYSSIFLDLVI